MGPGRATRVLVGAAAFVVVCIGIRLAEPILVPLLLAAFVAVASSPIVLGLVRRRVPVVLAVLSAVLVHVALLGAFGFALGSSFRGFQARLPEYQQAFAQQAAWLDRWLAEHGLTAGKAGIADVLPRTALDLLVDLLGRVATLVSSGVLLLIVVVFMLFEAVGLRLKLERMVQRPEAREAIRSAAREVNVYLLVKTASSVATGLILGGWCALWGVDFPVLWGLLAFCLNYIPTLGSIIAAVPPILLALLQLGPGPMLGVASGYLVFNVAIGQVIEPRLLGRALGLSPLVVIVSVVFWGWLLGPIGALLSAPLTMVVKIWTTYTEDARWLGIALGPAREGLRDVPARISVPPHASAESSVPPLGGRAAGSSVPPGS
ncbi:MAG: AI-2E family transporter [Myxococcota bacterium]|nr:AI-2E family transporter [Myxococcota bacterium]MDW8363518.1 AI-2E family transporter [Myxococcales bacterium]